MPLPTRVYLDRPGNKMRGSTWPSVSHHFWGVFFWRPLWCSTLTARVRVSWAAIFEAYIPREFRSFPVRPRNLLVKLSQIFPSVRFLESSIVQRAIKDQGGLLLHPHR